MWGQRWGLSQQGAEFPCCAGAFFSGVSPAAAQAHALSLSCSARRSHVPACPAALLKMAETREDQPAAAIKAIKPNERLRTLQRWLPGRFPFPNSTEGRRDCAHPSTPCLELGLLLPCSHSPVTSATAFPAAGDALRAVRPFSPLLRLTTGGQR